MHLHCSRCGKQFWGGAALQKHFKEKHIMNQNIVEALEGQEKEQQEFDWTPATPLPMKSDKPKKKKQMATRKLYKRHPVCSGCSQKFASKGGLSVHSARTGCGLPSGKPTGKWAGYAKLKASPKQHTVKVPIIAPDPQWVIKEKHAVSDPKGAVGAVGAGVRPAERNAREYLAIGDGVERAGQSLGNGIMWAGFWVAIAIVASHFIH